MELGVSSRASPVTLADELPFRLGGAVVTPATREFVCGDRVDHLEPRVMQVLVALYRSRGAVVSRDALLARCWDGRTVGDNAIHRVISKIRSLGASCGGGFEIATIAKVGYRMTVGEPDLAPEAPPLAETKPASAVPGDPPSVAQAGAGPLISRPLMSRRRVFAAGAGAAAIVAGVSAASILSPGGERDDRVAELLAHADLAKSTGLPASDAQGIGFLEEAVLLRPRDPAIWGRLALASSIAAEYAAPDKTADLVAKTQFAAQRALSLDKDQGDAMSALALLPSYYGDWLAAEQRMRRVLERHPRHAPTRDALDFMLMGVGRCREACLSRVRHAASWPLDARYQYRLIYALWTLGRIEEADRAAERGLQLWPRHPGVWFAHLWTLAFTGREQRALARIEDAAGRPDLPEAASDALALSMQALSTRRRADIERASDSLFGLLQAGPGFSLSALLLLNGLGEIDRAFAVAEAYLLDRGAVIAALRWRAGDMSVNDQRRRKTNMLFTPVSAGMRSDPRFATLMEDIGLAAYWRQAGVTPDHLTRRV